MPVFASTEWRIIGRGQKPVKSRLSNSSNAKTLLITLSKYIKGINNSLLMGNVLNELKTTAIASLHPSILLAGLLRLLT